MATETSSSSASSRRGDPAARLHQQQGGHEAVGTHESQSSQTKCSVGEHFVRLDCWSSSDRPKERNPMLRGFATVNYFADDLIAARDWYAEPVGVDAVLPASRCGEPGVHRVPGRRLRGRAGHHRPPVRAAPPTSQPGGAVMYWHVDDVAAAVNGPAGEGRQGTRADHRARRRVRHRVGGRPVRQHPGRHVQPALRGDPRRALTIRP